MSVLPVGFGSSGGIDVGDIGHSLRLRAAASAYFSRTPASAGNSKTWTFSVRGKRGTLGAGAQAILSAGPGSNTDFGIISFDYSGYADKICVIDYPGGGSVDLRSTRVCRDTSGHYHLVVTIDTTQATAADRVKIWWNNEQITAFDSATYPSLNADTRFNSTSMHYIGAGRYLATSSYYDGLLSDVHFVDGQALTPSSFGEQNADGVWVPKPYTGTYGANGFKLDFADAAVTSGSNAGLGKDTSGNGNYWNTNNISVTAGVTYDSMVDTPTNNYATLNPLANAPFGGTTTFSAGNLQVTTNTSRQHILASYRLGPEKKYYWECSRGNASSSGYQTCGIAKINTAISSSPNYAYPYNVWGYNNAGSKSADGVQSGTYTASSATTDVWGFEWDGPNSTLTCYLNNTSLFSITGLTGEYVPYFGIETPCDIWVNFGQRPFAYMHSGFNSLCTANLPAVAITKPASAFKVTLATEDNIYADVATAHTGWADYIDILKNRAASESWAWQFSHDSSNEYAISAASVTRQTKRTQSGSNSWVGYSIRIGATWGTAAGSASHTNGADTTVTHSVGLTTRQMIFLFPRAGGSTVKVYHPDLASGKLLDLCSNAAETTDATIKTVTSTSFKIDAAMATGTYDYLVLSELSGFFALGKYVATGSGTDQPFSWCNHRPIAGLFKVISAADNFVIVDAARSAYNVAVLKLNPDSSGAEGTMGSGGLDIVSAGHKPRTPADGIGSAQTITFASWAAHPFGGSNVAPSPAR